MESRTSNIDYSLDLETIKKHLSSWNEIELHHVKFERIEGGFSSVIHKVSVSDQQVKDKLNLINSPSVILFRRINGHNLLTDYEYLDQLEKIFIQLSELGLGAKFLGGDKSYRIEEFIECRVIKSYEINYPSLRKKLCLQLGKFNSLTCSFKADKKQGFIKRFLKENIFNQIQKNLSIKNEDTVKNDWLEKMKILISEEELQFIYKIEESEIENFVLSHNDIWVGNILLYDNSEKIMFVDYEMVNYNFQGCDLGKLIMETMYERDESNLKHKLNEKYFPNDEEIKEFLRYYLIGFLSKESSIDELENGNVDELEKQIYKDESEKNEKLKNLYEKTQLGLMFSGYYSSLVGLLIGDNRNFPLDFIQFAIDGFQCYQKFKEMYLNK